MSRPAALPPIQISGPAEGMANYIRAVEGAGGRPVPGYAPEPDPDCLGLVLCGGGDLDPAWFGQENRGSHPPDPRRDAAELTLVRAYLAWGRPILGICRGMQVLNTALGGTLLQDLGRARNRVHCGAEDVFHPIRTAPESLLELLFGGTAQVNSAHHQGIDRLGEGLRLTAWAPDGTAEGVEHRTCPAVGVQFHPERLPHGLGAGLFRWLAERAEA